MQETIGLKKRTLNLLIRYRVAMSPAKLPFFFLIFPKLRYRQ